MLKHYSIKPYSLIKTMSGIFVLHYLIRFDPATGKFFDRKTGEEIRVSSHDVNEDYAGWFILKQTVLLVDGTAVDSSQIHCDPETGACVDRTTNQPVQLQPNQVHFVVIDHQNLCGIDYVSELIRTQMKINQGKTVRAKQVRQDFWNGPFYGIEYVKKYDKSYQIQSFNFDELILSKVVIVPDGDNYFFYSMRSPTYNAFGSTILFKLV